jgi:hypothetical protein
MQDKCSIKNQGQQARNKEPTCRISKWELTSIQQD